MKKENNVELRYFNFVYFLSFVFHCFIASLTKERLAYLKFPVVVASV